MPQYAILIFSAISCVLASLPFPWHWRAKNVGTITLMIYLFISNLDIFINTAIWSRDVGNAAPAWCEISIRVRHIFLMAVPCCNLCIARRLESIASTREVKMTDRDKRKRLYIDLSITVGLPIMHLALMIINQGHRYDIMEYRGCWPSYFPTAVYLVLVPIPPVIVCLVSFAYSILALRWFMIRRRQFVAVLQASATTLNKSRYIRMMLFSIVDIAIFFPFIIALMITQVRGYGGLARWVSWSETHYGFNKVTIAADEIINASSNAAMLDLTRWTSPVSAILFFLMFGLGEEAIKTYKKALQHVGLLKKADTSSHSSSLTTSAYRSRDIAVESWTDDIEKSVASKASPDTERFPSAYSLEEVLHSNDPAALKVSVTRTVHSAS